MPIGSKSIQININNNKCLNDKAVLKDEEKQSDKKYKTKAVKKKNEPTTTIIPSKIPRPITGKHTKIEKTNVDSPATSSKHPSKINKLPDEDSGRFLLSDLRGVSENNRVDKSKHDLAYTYVIFTDTKDNKTHNARMLNTTPDIILKQKGFSQQECESFQYNKKNNTISDKALGLADFNPEDVSLLEKNLARRLGKGSFGNVKFSEIYDHQSQKNIVVAAKKITLKSKDDEASLLNEITLQNKAGSIAPKVYGMSKTKNKNNKDDVIIFMEIASGISGSKLIYKHLAGISTPLTSQQKEKITENLLHQVQKLHNKGVYHGDLGWNNIIVDLDNDCEIKIIDYGFASDKKQSVTKRPSAPTTLPPESVITSAETQDIVDVGKIDIFSLGTMLCSLYQTDIKLNSYVLNRHNDIPKYWGDSVELSGDEQFDIIEKQLQSVSLSKEGG